MSRRMATLITLAALVAVTLSGCTARGESATIEAPAWSAGFTWAYEGDYAFSYKESFQGETDDHNESGQYRLSETVVNTGFDLDGEGTYTTVRRIDADTDDLPFPVGRPMLAAYRQRDLKDLEVDGARSETCNTRGACTARVQELELSDPAPDIERIPFPVRTGDTWGGTYELYDGIMMRVTAEAGRMVKVDTPLGPIEAMRIEYRHAITNAAETVREAEAEAREDGYEVEDLRIDIRFEEAVYYSPLYKTVVRYGIVGGERFSATVPDETGGKSKASFESRFEEHNALSGARFIAGPERSLEEIGIMLATGEGIDNVTGTPVPESTYGLGVRVLDGHVNTYGSESGQYEAVLDGTDALPEGHSLHWSLVDRNGHAQATGNGTRFEPAPGQAGQYAVTLEALDGHDTVVATAGSILVADYEGPARIDCGLVTARPVVQIGDCDALGLPVHPGVTAVHLTASSDAGNPTARLRVQDALGRDVPVQQNGQIYTVDLESFAGYNLGDEPWIASWDATVGLLETASVDIAVHYGVAPMAVEIEGPIDGEHAAGPHGLTGALPTWLGGLGASADPAPTRLHAHPFVATMIL